MLLFNKNWISIVRTMSHCSLIRSDEKESDFIVNSTVNSEVQIKTSDVESDVESVVLDIENWSYSLKFDDIIVIVCLCEDSSNKDSKSETRILFQFLY